MNLVVPIWKRYKKHIPSFSWKSIPAMVENSYPYRLDMDPCLAMGGSTIDISKELKQLPRGLELVEELYKTILFIVEVRFSKDTRKPLSHW